MPLRSAWSVRSKVAWFLPKTSPGISWLQMPPLRACRRQTVAGDTPSLDYPFSDKLTGRDCTLSASCIYADVFLR